jgi:hypothetical protein
MMIAASLLGRDEFLEQFPTVPRETAVQVLEERRLALMAA